MEQRLSEEEKKRKRILIIIAIILLLLIIFLFLIIHRKTYEITFNSNGGSEVASVKVKDGDKIEEPDDPVREGYIFAGWYYLNELYSFDNPVRSDMTLEAEWAEQVNAELEGISLDATELALSPDGTAVLVATLLPENAKQVKLIWTSSDESIATVDENGNIKALKEGTVTITVTTEDGKYTASCTVTVTKDAVAVEGDEASYPITVNSNSNNNNNNNNSKKPSTPSNPSNPNPSTPGEPKNTPVTGVKITNQVSSMNVGNTSTLQAEVTPSNATNKKVKWSSNNPSVVSVDQNGKITALSEGEATITVTTEDGGKTDECKITVSSVYEITLTPKVMEGTGAVTQYSYVVKKDGRIFTNYIAFYYSSLLIEPGSGTIDADTVQNNRINTTKIVLQGGAERNAKVVIK